MAETNKQIVEKVNAGFAANDPEVFLSFCADDAEWKIAGDQTLKGKNAVREFVSGMKEMEAPTFDVEELVAEGDSVICYGDMTMKMEKDDKPAPYSYVDAYRFSNGKITRLQTFVVKHKTEGEKSGKATA